MPQRLVQKYNVKKMAEIGILTGNTAVRILKECKGIEIYLMIDPWIPYDDGSSTSRDMTKEKMDELYKKVVKRMEVFPQAYIFRKSSVRAAKMVVDNYLDLVYIDAAHDTKSVLEDIHAWIPKIKDDGIISGHDYGGGWPTVVKAVDQAYPDFDPKTRLPHCHWFIELNKERKQLIFENSKEVKE